MSARGSLPVLKVKMWSYSIVNLGTFVFNMSHCIPRITGDQESCFVNGIGIPASFVIGTVRCADLNADIIYWILVTRRVGR